MVPAAQGTLRTLGTPRTLRTLKRVYVAGAVLWAASIVAAALAASQPAGHPVAYAFALAVYSMGSVLCHQRPERSFHLWMVQLPVCARCTGIYAGAALAALTATSIQFPPITGVPQWGKAALLVASVPTIITLVYEWTMGSMVSNMVRAAAGLPLGAAVALVLLAAAGAKRPEVN